MLRSPRLFASPWECWSLTLEGLCFIQHQACLKSRVILPFCPTEADFLPKGEMSSKLSEMLPCVVLSSKACVAVPCQCCICCPVPEGLHCRCTATHRASSSCSLVLRAQQRLGSGAREGCGG